MSVLKVIIALLSQLVFLIKRKLCLLVSFDIETQFNFVFRQRNSFIMENLKQIMSNVDSYMLSLIEAVEPIQSNDFPHPEGQLFAQTFLLAIVKNKTRCQGQIRNQ